MGFGDFVEVRDLHPSWDTVPGLGIAFLLKCLAASNAHSGLLFEDGYWNAEIHAITLQLGRLLLMNRHQSHSKEDLVPLFSLFPASGALKHQCLSVHH